jgi:hypothetical protein
MQNGHKIYQKFQLQRFPKFIKIVNFGMKIYHLATLLKKHTEVRHESVAFVNKVSNEALFAREFFEQCVKFFVAPRLSFFSETFLMPLLAALIRVLMQNSLTLSRFIMFHFFIRSTCPDISIFTKTRSFDLF